ncbi:MAG: dehydrogenase, partial [Segetibacter sp.]|nr:dehydrogenase [Segetibacter sp.]
TDAWCRPVQFYTGPDGALYVIDYYREIIEHPEWMSDSVNKSGALYHGSDKGRIYRITPVNTGKMNWCNNIKLGSASTEDLVRTLTNNNIWWRRNAQRLLMDRKDPKTTSLLQQLLDTTTSAIATVHALWTMEGFNAMNDAILRKALHHTSAGVRENAIQIAEAHLQQFPQLENDLLSLQNDPDAKVRYQLLCTLGNSNDVQSETVRQKLLMKDIEDKWVQVAALSSSSGKEFALMEAVTASAKPSDGKKLFVKNCASVIGLSQRPGDVKKLIQLAANKGTTAAWWQSSCLEGLTKAIKTKGTPAGDFSNEKKLLLAKFTTAADAPLRTASLDLLSLLGIEKNASWNDAVMKAKAVAIDKKAAVDFRNDALKLLALDKNNSYTKELQQLVTPEEPESIQQNALQAYNKISGKDAAAFIISKWKNLTPAIREVAVGVLLSSNENKKLLLDALEKNQIQSTAISWPRMVQLMGNNDETVRNRSRALFANKMEDRDEVFKNYQPALTMKGDAAQGLLLFKKACATCHQVGGQYGKEFGPDLASIRNRDAQFIMADILNPNRAIADNYETWDIEKRNGEKVNGIIASETPAAITLHHIGGQETILSRSDIKTMEASTTSSMPVGLEKSVSVKEMADLLAFLKNIH